MAVATPKVDFERCLSNRRQIAAEAFAETKSEAQKTLLRWVIYFEELRQAL